MYGLLGENISYTYSPLIHKCLGYDYKVIDLDEEAFDHFMRKKNFKGINVTIPYKSKVIGYLDYVEPIAKKLNAVNTIVNIDNKLYGYNTDIKGFEFALDYNQVPVKDNSVLILGTGSTSSSISEVFEKRLAKNIVKIGRSTKINYDNLETVRNFDIIVNTTPVGVYPNISDGLINLDEFSNLQAVIDVIYNPLRTKLVSDAIDKGVKAYGGLLMLVAQAVFASEIFFDKEYDNGTIEKVYQEVLNKKENIVLIGMPSCGKSTIAKDLALSLNKEFIDIDAEIVKSEEMSITEIFKEYGEDYFRNVESSVVYDISKYNSKVIATGGGVILDKNNIINLKRNGKLIFLERDLEKLIVSSDRPLSSDKDKIQELYNSRINLYRKYSDYTVSNNKTIIETLEKIWEIV